MNIYKHELRAPLPSVWIWSVSIALLIVAFMAFAQTFAADTALLSQMMAKFPEQLLIAFGMAEMDWSTILGYFGLVVTFVQICLAIQAANYGFGLVSIEESELTADFLLAKPVSRKRILTSKLLAALTCLAITQAVVWACSWVSITYFGEGQAYDAKALNLLLLSLAVFQLFFLMVSIAISLLVRRVRSVTPYALGLVFGLYILNAFGGMIGERSLEVLSPFTHFSPNYIIKHAAWDLPLVLISIAITVVALVGSYVLYAKRDIAAAV